MQLTYSQVVAVFNTGQALSTAVTRSDSKTVTTHQERRSPNRATNVTPLLTASAKPAANRAPAKQIPNATPAPLGEAGKGEEWEEL